jgi:hypothetical protein
MPKKKIDEEVTTEEPMQESQVPEYDPETEELKMIPVYDNGKMRGHSYRVEKKKEKTSDEIIADRIIELKILIAKEIATDQNREDLKLLLS